MQAVNSVLFFLKNVYSFKAEVFKKQNHLATGNTNY